MYSGAQRHRCDTANVWSANH